MAFGPLLRGVATVHRMTPRAMLPFLAREWGRLTTGELGRRLRRDPSMVSRLTATYAAQRDAALEAQVRRVLDPKIPE